MLSYSLRLDTSLGRGGCNGVHFHLFFERTIVVHRLEVVRTSTGLR